MDDSESDNWSDVDTSDDSLPKPTAKKASVIIDGFEQLKSGSSPTEGTILFDDQRTPLFLHFKCSINNFGSIPIKVLPTCLYQVLKEFKLESPELISLPDLYVSLDIICSTLPSNDDLEDDHHVSTASYESSPSPMPPSSPTQSESSFRSDMIA